MSWTLTPTNWTNVILDWTWDQRLVFLALVNNIFSVDDTEEALVELLEVTSGLRTECHLI